MPEQIRNLYNLISDVIRANRGSLLILAALSFYISCGPLRLYLQNRFYFGIDVGSVIILVLGVFFSVALCLGMIYFTLSQRARKQMVRATITILAILFVYSEILFFLIPELDGATGAVPNPWYYLLDIVCLGFGAAIFVVTSKDNTRSSVANLIASFVFIFVGLQVLSAFVFTEGDDGAFSYRVPARFPLSSDTNVIHLLFDTLQSTEFVSQIEKSNLEKDFDGFTVFVDMLGVARSTERSLPSIFSGKYFNDRELINYYSGQETTVLDVLARQGFDINVISVLPLSVPEQTSMWKDWQIVTDVHDLREELGELIDLYLIRALPFAFKDIFLNNYDWFFANVSARELNNPHGSSLALSLLENYTERLSKVSGSATPPTYYFVHLLTPHPPYTHLEDCSYAGKTLPRDPERYAVQVRCALLAVTELLERLKEMGIYDNTVVILQADTGSYDAPELQSLDVVNEPGMAFPTLAVKPLRARGQITMSNLPASLIDVPNTLLGALDIDSDFEGYDLLAEVNLSNRKRRFEDFVIAGNAFDPSGWAKAPEGEKVAGSAGSSAGQDTAYPLLRSLDTVFFDPAGIGKIFVDGEWGKATRAYQPAGTPALVSGSRLRFKLDDRIGAPVKSLLFEASFPGGTPTETHLNLNGEDMGQIEFVGGERGLLEFRIPVEQISDRSRVEIEFQFEQASPHPALPDDTGFVLHRMFVAEQ